jgi:hypothetical protein
MVDSPAETKQKEAPSAGLAAIHDSEALKKREALDPSSSRLRSNRRRCSASTPPKRSAIGLG